MSSMLQKARRTLIGDKAFYRTLLAIIIPVIIAPSRKLGFFM